VNSEGVLVGIDCDNVSVLVVVHVSDRHYFATLMVGILLQPVVHRVKPLLWPLPEEVRMEIQDILNFSRFHSGEASKEETVFLS